MEGGGNDALLRLLAKAMSPGVVKGLRRSALKNAWARVWSRRMFRRLEATDDRLQLAPMGRKRGHLVHDICLNS